MQEKWKVTLVLCCVWAASLLYGEMVAFWAPSLWRCSWPQLPLAGSHSSSTNMTNGVPHLGKHVKVAVITDPQLEDETSRGLSPKSLALEIMQFYTDLYMRRSFLMSVLPLKPDIILFLGDYFDGGPQLLDEEWQASLSRFRHIFDLSLNQKGRYSNTPVHYIPGNHDIGYAARNSRNRRVIGRYEQNFGSRNYRINIGEVDFIIVDSQTLDGTETEAGTEVSGFESAGLEHGDLTAATWNFVKNVSKEVVVRPRVLLTHIPLYRPDHTQCGPHRTSPIINQRVSRFSRDQDITYQNYLTQETSGVLLDLIRPILVLSGHDHDQCTVTHLTNHGPVTEHTIGTFSWQQGNWYPSYMLLSVSNLRFPNTTKPEDAISTQLCFLPVQVHIYIWYLSLLVFTVLVLLIWPSKGLQSWQLYTNVVGSMGKALNSIFKAGSKEKDEDENCEYEMMWDAEGSMHLVKKLLKKNVATASSESELVGRGNAVMRQTAKKPVSQELEASVTVEMNANSTLEGGKLVHRSSRSKTKMIRQIIRTFWFIATIFALNVTLYMMLLFKDLI